MPPMLNSNFRLIWIHNESGPSGIPAGFSRDNSYDNQALQGSTSGGISGVGIHIHSLPQHYHTSDTHIHYISAQFGGPMTITFASQRKPVTTYPAATISHRHHSKASTAASIDYNTTNPNGTNSISSILPQHITTIIIKPDTELSSIPSGIVAFTDNITPPEWFYNCKWSR